MSRSLAAALDDLGVAEGERVAIVSPNAARFLVALFGVSAYDRVLVPVNYRLNAEEIAYIVQHSGSTVERRCAIRNMETAGVSQSVAMKISGHTTTAVYRRYRIVDETDLCEAFARTRAAMREAPGRTVVTLPRAKPAEGRPAQTPAQSAQDRLPLDLPLVAELSATVDVSGEIALAGAREAHALVERVGAVEAGVRPEDEPRGAVPAAPGEDGLAERAAETSSAKRGVEVEAMELGGRRVQPLDPGRAHHLAAVADHEEAPARRGVVPVEGQEIGDLLGRVEDEAVLLEDAADQADHPRAVARIGRLHGEIRVGHPDSLPGGAACG
jgi:AMP-binding enzyme